VTGAARERGIGRGIAVCLAEEGCAVAVNDLGADAEGTALVAELRDLGVDAQFYAADVTDRRAIDDMISSIEVDFGPLNIVCSNAGVAEWKTILDTEEADFDRVVGVNLTGAFNVCQAGLQAMLRSGQQGSIVVTSSVNVQMPFAAMALYGATKGGLKGLVETMAIEAAPYGITINHIGPGWVRSFINDRSPSLQTDQEVADTLKLIPAGRPAEPRDLGRAVVYLCSADGDYVTGEYLRIDGGFVVGKY